MFLHCIIYLVIMLSYPVFHITGRFFRFEPTPEGFSVGVSPGERLPMTSPPPQTPAEWELFWEGLKSWHWERKHSSWTFPKHQIYGKFWHQIYGKFVSLEGWKHRLFSPWVFVKCVDWMKLLISTMCFLRKSQALTVANCIPQRYVEGGRVAYLRLKAAKIQVHQSSQKHPEPGSSYKNCSYSMIFQSFISIGAHRSLYLCCGYFLGR